MIELRDVAKHYRTPLGRTIRAVEGLSLRIGPGEVVGLAGPNGAGKSTLLNLLLGYLRPTSGWVAIDGLPPRDWIEANGIGYVSELIAIPPAWTVDAALVRYALLAGIPDGELRTRVEASVARLGLETHRRKRVRHLSKGTAQRLGIAQALLRDERVLIFDEPTHGLDPLWVQRFREIVRELRAPERAILIASHDLDELERVADRVAIIDGGRLRRVVALGDAPNGSGAPRWRLRVAAGAALLRERFPDAVVSDAEEVELRGVTAEALNAALAMLIPRGLRITALSPAHPSLERVFREVVGE